MRFFYIQMMKPVRSTAGRAKPPTALTLPLFFCPSVHLESEVQKTGIQCNGMLSVVSPPSCFLRLRKPQRRVCFMTVGVSVQGCQWTVSWSPRAFCLACWQACRCGSSNSKSLRLEVWKWKHESDPRVWLWKRCCTFNSQVVSTVFVPTVPLAPPAPSVCHRERRKGIEKWTMQGSRLSPSPSTTMPPCWKIQ